MSGATIPPSRHPPRRRTPSAVRACGLAMAVAVVVVALTGPSRAAAAEPATSEAVVIQYWHAYGGAIGEAHGRLVDEFNALHPRIHVESVFGGNLWTMRDKLAAALAAGTAPDVAGIDQFWVAELADAGHARPLEELQGPDGWLDGIAAQYLEAGRYRGTLYAVPFAVSTVVLYYNADLLSELGLDEDDVPSTWEELLALGRARPAPGREGPWILGTPTTAQTGVVYHYLITLWQQGGEVFAPDGRSVAFDDEAGVAALALWQDLVASGALDLATSDRAWEAGRVLFQLASSAHLAATYADLPFRVEVAPLPAAAYRVTGAGGRSMAVLTDDPDRSRAAAAFMAWMVSADVNLRWSLQTGYSPLRLATYGSASFQAELRADPRLERVLHETLYARLRPNHLAYAEVSRILGEAVEAALYRRLDPRAALALAAAEADDVVHELSRDRRGSRP